MSSNEGVRFKHFYSGPWDVRGRFEPIPLREVRRWEELITGLYPDLEVQAVPNGDGTCDLFLVVIGSECPPVDVIACYQDWARFRSQRSSDG